MFGAGASESWFVVPEGVATRWINPENSRGEKGQAGQSLAGRKGAPCYGKLEAGRRMTLVDIAGTSGVIRHLWSTIDKRTPKMLRGLRMEFYWDGARRPAVSAPYGDLFGTGLGCLAPFQSALFTSPEGRNINCYIPMPFRKACRIEVTNETDEDIGMFWFQADLTVGDALPADALYFHAHFRRENLTTLQQDYEFLPRVEGKGRYLGVNAGVIANQQLYFKSWWGEGEVKCYLDGDREHPTLCGTGTEDYIGSAWGQGRFDNLFQGCQVADHERCRYCFYRYHIPDPVYFRKDIRVTIQQIGCWDPNTLAQMHGNGLQLNRGDILVDMAACVKMKNWGLFERQDDWSSCAYFYLDRAENDLPALPPVAERLAGL